MTNTPASADDQEVDEFVDDGLAPRSLVPPVEGPFVRPNGQTYVPRMLSGMQDVAYLRKCRETQEHVLLYGPPGTGKTALPEAVHFPGAVQRENGTYLHLGMESLVCSMDTTESDFFGTFYQDPATGNFEWTPGPLQRAVEYGVPLYIDEIFLADARVLSSTLYPLMDGRGVLRIPMNPRLDPIPVPDGFFVIGSGNPDVPGANFSEALRDRFPHQIEVETDWELASSLGVPRYMIAAARSLNEKRRNGLISWSPQLRSLLAFRDNKRAFGKEYALSALLGKTPFRDRQVVAQALPGGDSIQPLSLGKAFGRE